MAFMHSSSCLHQAWLEHWPPGKAIMRDMLTSWCKLSRRSMCEMGLSQVESDEWGKSGERSDLNDSNEQLNDTQNEMDQAKYLAVWIERGIEFTAVVIDRFWSLCFSFKLQASNFKLLTSNFWLQTSDTNRTKLNCLTISLTTIAQSSVCVWLNESKLADEIEWVARVHT